VIDDEQSVRHCAEFISLRMTFPAAVGMRQFVLFLFSAISAMFGAANRQCRNLSTGDRLDESSSLARLIQHAKR
jgi:hypothetical protein